MRKAHPALFVKQVGPAYRKEMKATFVFDLHFGFAGGLPTRIG